MTPQMLKISSFSSSSILSTSMVMKLSCFWNTSKRHVHAARNTLQSAMGTSYEVFNTINAATYHAQKTLNKTIYDSKVLNRIAAVFSLMGLTRGDSLYSLQKSMNVALVNLLSCGP